MGEWKAALETNGIQFDESSPASVNYWIVAEKTCVASGFPYLDGKEVNGHERIVAILNKYSDIQIMQRECAFVKAP